MMIDSHFGGATEIIRHRKNLVGPFAGVDLVLCERAGSADREKLAGNSNKTGKQQLFTVELRSQSCHSMEQTAREFPTRARGVTNVRPELVVKFLQISGVRGQPLFWIPAGIKFPGSENRF